jgi:tetratricopeptide (TPR) repeat protein
MSKPGLPLVATVAVMSLAACSVTRPPPAFPQGGSATPEAVTPGAQTAPVPPAEEAAPAPTPGPGEEARPQPKQFHLGPAASALVAQAHSQASGGNYQAAGATLERAQRIEPGNPLLYIELGQVRLQEDNPGQAGAFGQKALSLATGDPQAQAQAWRLIADSLRAQGRDPEAVDADRRADALAPR